MSSDLRQGFRLGPWKIEPLIGAVTGPDGDSLHLEPKVMDVFVCLAERPNELISRDQLLDAVWSGHVAADELLTRAISELRHALHDVRSNPTYIETIPKRGYRLIGEVRLPDGTALEQGAVHPEPFIYLTGRKLGAITFTVLVLVLAYVAFDTFVIDPAQEEPQRDAISLVDSVGVIDAPDKSIAVLPFVNMSGDPDNEYFSDGLSEEILNLLTKIPGLKVIGRTSSFAFKGKNEDLRVIGQRLGVKTVLEGSVRRSGDRVRITAQLNDVSDGSHIWSETYDRTMIDIFAVQDDVAAAIIDALQIHVAANPTRGRPTENTEAYALFLKAQSMGFASDGGDPKRALLEAIELDPSFAEAYELLAQRYWLGAGSSVETNEAFRLMGEAAAKALAIDPDLVLAQALYQTGISGPTTLFEEIEAFERATREQPGSAMPLHALRWDLMMAGYLQEAADVAERYVELEPLSVSANMWFFESFYAIGRTDEALAALEIAYQLYPDSMGRMDADIGYLNLVAERDEIAIAHLESFLRKNDHPDPTWVRELVTTARDPDSGQAYLDRRIPRIVASMPESGAFDWRREMVRWYLYFGFLDRYMELILDPDLSDSSWRDNMFGLVQTGTIYRRLGFTAHPKYLEVVNLLGIIDVWEQRGPPDFCEKVDGQWVCK